MSDYSNFIPQFSFIDRLKSYRPDAYAVIEGNKENSDLKGTAYFYQTHKGVLVEAEVFNLPFVSPDNCIQFYGMHIHENGDCTPPFDKTGNHLNNTNQPHPMHTGDMPPLLGNCGYAYSVFYTERFNISDIINRSLVIHSNPDDFTTQPSGNSGDKIGCGIIKQFRRR